MVESQCYEIMQTPNKGIGMFASRDICKGEVIIEEKPIIQYFWDENKYISMEHMQDQFPHDMVLSYFQLYTALSKENQAQVMQLSDSIKI